MGDVPPRPSPDHAPTLSLHAESPSELGIGAAPRTSRAGGAPRLRRRRRWLVGAVVAGVALLLGMNVAAALPSDGAAERGMASSLQGVLARLRGPVRVGLQVGHLDAAAQPDELASLRASTGAHAAGVDEVDVNRAVVDALARRLEAHGFAVDVLPASVPAGYRADLVLAIHADANADPAREGYKSAHFTPARNAREPLLKLDIDRAVLLESGLGDDDRNVSGNMLRYYAFNRPRFRHSVARRTPALLVEMGYLSNARDRRLLLQPERLAGILERGVVSYLRDVGRIPRGGG